MKAKLVVCIGGCMDSLVVQNKGHKYVPLSRLDQRDYFVELTIQEQMDFPEPKDEYELIPGGTDFDYYVLSGDLALMNESLDKIKSLVKQ